MDNYLKKFTDFIEGINLEEYRKKFLPIKIVEMDMTKNIQAISLLYKVYGNEKRLISFEDFYQEYRNAKMNELEEFRKKTQMCKKCFDLGLPARIYRTWASIITQIHAGFVAESVFTPGTVKMSEELDHQGADFQVLYKDRILNYQVKKETQSREVRREKRPSKQLSGEFINIEYKVPVFNIITNPKKKNGEYRKSYLDFKKKWLDTNKIIVLNNGFVIFTPKIFEDKKREIDSVSR